MKNLKTSIDDYINVFELQKDISASWKNFNVERLVIIREKLVFLLDKSMHVADSGMKDASEGLGTRTMLDAVSTADKLLSMLDKLSGLSSRVSLDVAIEEVTKAGYQVIGGETQEIAPQVDMRLVSQKVKELYDEAEKSA